MSGLFIWGSLHSLYTFRSSLSVMSYNDKWQIFVKISPGLVLNVSDLGEEELRVELVNGLDVAEDGGDQLWGEHVLWPVLLVNSEVENLKNKGNYSDWRKSQLDDAVHWLLLFCNALQWQWMKWGYYRESARVCHSHHLTCANIRSKYFAGEDNAHFFKINLIMSRSSLHGFDASDGSRSTPESSHGSMLQTENQIIPLSVTPARCGDVMTKVTSLRISVSMGLNAQIRHQRPDCIIL